MNRHYDHIFLSSELPYACLLLTVLGELQYALNTVLILFLMLEDQSRKYELALSSAWTVLWANASGELAIAVTPRVTILCSTSLLLAFWYSFSPIIQSESGCHYPVERTRLWKGDRLGLVTHRLSIIVSQPISNTRSAWSSQFWYRAVTISSKCDSRADRVTF